MNAFIEFKKKHRRPASRLQQTDEVRKSVWGDCTVAINNPMDWPCNFHGDPLAPIVELHLEELPLRTQRLDTLQIIQVFMDPLLTSLPSKKPQKCDGRYITVRSYDAIQLQNQVPLKHPFSGRYIIPKSYIKGVFIDDYPMDDMLYTADFFESAYGREMTLDEEDEHNLNFFSKIGGWPHFISGGIPEESEEYGSFVFQLDSDCGFEWGRSGTWFFFYKESTAEWFYYWESFPY